MISAASAALTILIKPEKQKSSFNSMYSKKKVLKLCIQSKSGKQCNFGQLKLMLFCSKAKIKFFWIFWWSSKHTWESDGCSLDHSSVNNEWRYIHQMNFVIWMRIAEFLMQCFYHTYLIINWMTKLYWNIPI